MIEIEAAFGELDDDVLVDEVDGRLYEVLDDGRRVPLDDDGPIIEDKVVCIDPATGREIPRRPAYASPKLGRP